MFMEFLPSEETLNLWLANYGGLTLFGLLALEIIALPIPGETLMLLAGVLLCKGELSIVPTLLAGYAGSICGINISYALGRTMGTSLVKNYGSYIGLSEQRMHKAHDWFARFGKWALMIGYFIPGVRHFTGFTAGMSSFEFKDFAIFAYTGAIIWVTLFLSVGYFFGDYWLSIFETVSAKLTNTILF
jgi:membrane protein DedA with SNARE-associated domain